MRCFIVQAQTANIELKFLSDQTAMQESIEQYMQTVGQQARQASRVLASASTNLKTMRYRLFIRHGKLTSPLF